VTAALCAPAALVVDRWEGGLEGLAAGAIFSLASGVAGWQWLKAAARRSPRRFVAAVFGSLVARLAGVGVFAALLAVTGVAHLAVALVSVAALHVVFGMVEVVYLHGTGTLE
jgi:hypothetical protein